MDKKKSDGKRDEHGQKEPLPSEDEVLRRMLNTPPKPRKAKPKKDGGGRPRPDKG